jgi:tRNA 2-selenouridine synthase
LSSQSTILTPETFYQNLKQGLLLDTRSPAEFEHGHIAGAVSFPLFSDEMRAEIGTLYKKEGKDKAVRRGLEVVGPKMVEFVDEAKILSGGRDIFLYCWRGGMRSSSMQWLLQTAGLKVHRLEGGYKAYRTWMYEQFEKPATFITVGGLTGSGKTEILKELATQGEQIIDLEELAAHFGSAFGNLDAHPQPTTEHFQNTLIEQLYQLDHSRPIWVEDESQHIGKVWINDEFFKQIKSCPLVIVQRSNDDRINHLCSMYAGAEKDDLIDGFERISKRLGGQHVKAAVECIEEGNFGNAAAIALNYYDKSYNYMLEKRECPKYTQEAAGLSAQDIAAQLIQRKKEFHV